MYSANCGSQAARLSQRGQGVPGVNWTPRHSSGDNASRVCVNDPNDSWSGHMHAHDLVAIWCRHDLPLRQSSHLCQLYSPCNIFFTFLDPHLFSRICENYSLQSLFDTTNCIALGRSIEPELYATSVIKSPVLQYHLP